MGGVVVVALQDIAIRRHDHVVRVAHVVGRHGQPGAIRVDPHRRSPDVDMAVGTQLADRFWITVITPR